MKKQIFFLALALAATCPMVSSGQPGIEKDPGFLAIDKSLDLKAIHPEVNINLPRFLLKDVASGLNGGPDDPLKGTGIDIADLIKDVKLIRVVVIEANSTNRSALSKGMKALKSELEGKWTPIVTVPEENVGVYAMGDPSGESMAGIAVIVYNDGDAVIGNIVGRVSVGKLIQVASKMGKMPKGMLEKLKNVGTQTNGAAAEDSGDKKPVEKSDSSPKKLDEK